MGLLKHNSRQGKMFTRNVYFTSQITISSSGTFVLFQSVELINIETRQFELLFSKSLNKPQDGILSNKNKTKKFISLSAFRSRYFSILEYEKKS